MWKSLKDASRYHKKKKIQGKSGDSAAEDEEEADYDWEFKETLAFTTPVSSKYPRKYVYIF